MAIPSLCMRLARYAGLFLVMLLSLACAAGAADAGWDARLARGVLGNGLTYILHDSGREGDPFNIRLIVHAGSVDEDTPSGVAHILEHMVFQSTRAHPETLHRHIQRIGWRTGLQVNAVTREAETQYMIRTRPADALDLDGSLALLADLAFGAALRAEDWEKERSVILEELRQGESVADRINRQKKALLRIGSRYVDRPTIGTREGIEKATVADIRAFYERFYAASNMTLIVSGRIDAAGAEASIRRHFGPAPLKPRPERSYLVLPLKDGLSVGTVRDAGGTSSQVTYAFRLAMPDRASEAGQFAYLQKYLLNRLIRNAVEKQVAAPGGLGVVLQETTENRLILAFNAKGEDHAAAVPVLLEAVERLRREGLSRERYEAEIAAARRINDNNIEAAGQRTYAEWEDRIASAVLMNSTLDAPATRAERTRALLDRMSFDGLNARLRDMLAAPDRVLFYQVPGKADPAAPDAAAVEAERLRLAALAALPPLPPPAAPASAAPEALPAWPEAAQLAESGSLVSAVRREDPAISEWRLSNGDRLVWLERQTPDGRVYLSGQTARGYMNAEFGSLLSQAALQLWTQSGFRFWSQLEYERWKKAQPADWSWALQDGGLNVAATARPGDLPALFRRYAAAVAFGTVREEAAEDFAEGMKTHREDGGDYARLLYGPRASGLFAEAPDAERLTAAAQALLAEPVTWFAVGPPPEAATLDLFVKTVGALARAPSLTAAPDLQREGLHRASVRTLADERALVRMSFFAPMRWTPEAAFVVSGLTPLAQQALKNRLRHALGGVYTLQFELTLDPDTDRAVGMLSFHCAPGRAEELVAAALDVLKTMPDVARAADIERMRADIDFAEKARQAEPGTLVKRLALSYRRYGDAGYLARVGGLGKRVTAEGLARHAESIFRTGNIAILTELPDAKR